MKFIIMRSLIIFGNIHASMYERNFMGFRSILSMQESVASLMLITGMMGTLLVSDSTALSNSKLINNIHITGTETINMSYSGNFKQLFTKLLNFGQTDFNNSLYLLICY